MSVVLVSILAGAGIAGVLLSLGLVRAVKNKEQREGLRRDNLIRKRLTEESQVIHRKVELRIGHH